MEQKDIVFEKGIHREPSVSLSDAELSECVNLMPRHGELVNMKPAEMLNVHLETGEQLLAIHETSEYKHYITKYNGILHYIDKNSPTIHVSLSVSAANIKQVVAVGNALALIYDNTVNDPTPLKYLLWNTNAYNLLDEKPQVHLDFKLTGEQKGMSFPSTFTVAPISSASQSGGVYPDGVSNIYLTKELGLRIIKDYDETSSSDTYYYFIELTNDILFTYRLRAIRNYELTNMTGNAIFIVIKNTNTGNVSSKTINYGGSTEFEFNEYTSINIKESNYSLTRPTDYKFGYVIIRGQMPEELESETKFALTKSKKDSVGENSFTAMMGDVKEFIRYYSYEGNKFIFPFFVRYGLKYYDGSVSDLSEPILMMPNTGVVPQLWLDTYNGIATATAVSFVTDLKMKLAVTPQYADWKDIITGVVIGITAPIYYINEGEEYSPTKIQGSVTVLTGEETSTKVSNIVNDYGYYGDTKNDLSSSLDMYKPKGIMLPPTLPKTEYHNNFEKASIFYKIKEFSWNDLIEKHTDWGKLNTDDFSIKNITTLPVIQDIYNQNNKLYPDGAFVYNNRLNIFNVKEKLTVPRTPISPIQDYTQVQTCCVFYISDKGNTFAVSSGWKAGNSVPKWIYYPNTKTTKCVVYARQMYGATVMCYTKKEYELKTHNFLNGAYCLNINAEAFDFSTTIFESEVIRELGGIPKKKLVPNDNAIYASNASNPFYFPTDMMNLIGTGKIKAVSTAAKALSQGQFGQFPLYAFTDDGIWSLSVDGEGKYSTSNPVNRDVVANPESICQIDDSVIYACSQGLKQLTGSEAKLLTDAIDGHNVDESLFFGKDTSRTDISSLDSDHSGLVVADTDSMIHLAENCMIMYDPSGQRLLHVYPKTPNGKHYVYDLDSGEWSCEVGDSSKVKSVVPGYPYSTFVAPVKDEAGAEHDKLMQYTNAEHNNVTRYGVLLTRAYAMGDPFAMKMLRDIRLIYTKNNATYPAKCKVAVFVSNDRVNWKQLKSLRKHSYKWYRFRIQTAMTDLDALTSISMQVEERRTNKMR